MCCDKRWPVTTTVPNERELVLRVRYNPERVDVAYFTDALGDTLRNFEGFRIGVGAPLVCADEASGPDTGDFDWSFDKHDNVQTED